MIAFSPLRTRRLDVRLRELSIGDEIALCALPESSHEKALSEFLTHAIDSAGTPTDTHLSNPRAWSVGERLLALAHYCIHTRDDGPNYAVTEVSKIGDYLAIERDAPAPAQSFSVGGDTWNVIPLSGAAAEVLESFRAESTLPRRAHWLIGAMAAQLVRVGEVCPDAVAETAVYSEWLAARIRTIHAYPSSSFDALYANYRAALERDTQFFSFWFDEEGIVVLPKEAGAVTPPARFLVFAGIGEIALSVTGKA